MGYEADFDSPFCGAELFPLPANVFRAFALWAAEPVSPLFAAYCGPVVLGPAPAVCMRDPHPGSPWHWSDGTWWR